MEKKESELRSTTWSKRSIEDKLSSGMNFPLSLENHLTTSFGAPNGMELTVWLGYYDKSLRELKWPSLYRRQREVILRFQAFNKFGNFGSGDCGPFRSLPERKESTIVLLRDPEGAGNLPCMTAFILVETRERI